MFQTGPRALVSDWSPLRVSDWYVAVVCCHAFGVVCGFVAALHTLWTLCGSREKSSRTFLAVVLSVASSKRRLAAPSHGVFTLVMAS